MATLEMKYKIKVGKRQKFRQNTRTNIHSKILLIQLSFPPQHQLFRTIYHNFYLYSQHSIVHTKQCLLSHQ